MSFRKKLIFIMSMALCIHGSAEIITAKEIDQKISPLYLSGSDSRYAVMERLQGEYCAESRVPCTISTGFCVVNAMGIIKNQNKLTEEEAFDSAIRLCSTRATKYEFPLMHFVLQEKLNIVDKISKQLGCQLKYPPIISTLPVDEINVSVWNFSMPMILVNSYFIDFIREFSQLASLTIPFDGNSIITDEEMTQNIIEKSMDLRGAYKYVMDYYRTGIRPERRNYNDNKLSAAVSFNYTEDVLVFAIAHEYGHLCSKIERSALSNRPSYVDELKADIFSLKLLAKYESTKKPANSFIKLDSFGAAEFYFFSRGILEGNKNPNYIDKPLFKEGLYIAYCAYRNACNLEEKLKNLKELEPDRSHPSPAVRRLIVKKYGSLVKYGSLDNEDKDSERPFVDLLTRNAQILVKSMSPDVELSP
jgi:hypothetical protein